MQTFLLIIFNRLREYYQDLILQHIEYGASISCKEVGENLWKLCFYVKIEEYRKSIRKTTILLEDKGGSSRPLADGLALKARTHLVKLVTVFTKFLSDGSSFYQDLMLQVRERVRERERESERERERYSDILLSVIQVEVTTAEKE